MPTFDKAKINIGLQPNQTKLDLSHDHITSSNFMDLQPVMYRHMMPKERLVVNANAFARLAPLSVPTYGRCRLNLRAFFVPFRTVMPYFTDFLVDTVSAEYVHPINPNSGIVTGTPVFSMNALWLCFTTKTIYIGGVGYPLAVNTGTATHYDFHDGAYYWLLTPQGRKFYKVIRSLGYVLFPPKKSTNYSYSALALLSYLRVYFDWYSASAYLDTNTYQIFASWFNYHGLSPLVLTESELSVIAQFVYRVCYDGDYFTSAWDNPVAPNSQLYSSFSIPDITNNAVVGGVSRNQVVTNDPTLDASPNINGFVPTNGTPYVKGALHHTTSSTSASHGVFTQYTDTALHALTDYMKSHQLAGARAVDRYLADFGINLPADKLNRSLYLGMSSIDITIGDVMNHADTAPTGQPSTLGDYAGQGHLNGGKTFEFQTSEFGLFIIMASVLPSQGYVQGLDRNNLHITKDAFFNGRFDCLGVQAIAAQELYVSNDVLFDTTGSSYDGVFGYVPRYAEYKVGHDQLTGDLSLPSVIDGGSSWHLNRMFDDNSFGSTADNIRHGLGFVLGDDADQYNRIFNNTDPDVDKFYMIYQFDEVAYCPCKSLFDTYDWMEDNKDVVLDANGVKMN